jgi:hypothetical protein
MYWFLPLTYTLRKAMRLSSGKTEKKNIMDEKKENNDDSVEKQKYYHG